MKYLIASIALAAAPLAQAEFKSGNQLLAELQSTSTVDRAIALGYIVGVADMGMGVINCMPGAVTAGQITDLVGAWLTNNAAERHRSADVIVNYVLKTAWPCQKQPKRGGDV